MTNRPSVPEIITVNSETLQTQIRDLLPSQNGFGSELQASNVITPIIDLTSAAEGTGLSESLQTAIAFGSQTAFNVINTTTTLLNSPGFYRVFGTTSNSNYHSDSSHVRFQMTDGSSTKVVWGHEFAGDNSDATNSIQFDFVVWLAAGESLQATGNTVNAILAGSTRQIADSTGTLVDPSGYPL